MDRSADGVQSTVSRAPRTPKPFLRDTAGGWVVAAALLAPGCAFGAPDLLVSKAVDNPSPGPGEVVEFTVDLRNVGTDAAAEVQVLDPLPEGLEIPSGRAAFTSSGTYDPTNGLWDVGDVGPGGMAVLVIPAVISITDPPVCVVNVARVDHPDDAVGSNDRGAAGLRHPGVERCVDLGVTIFNLSVGPPFCGTEGDLTIVFDVTNSGSDPARDVVIVVTQSPLIAPNLRFEDARCSGDSGPVCRLATLAPGETFRMLAISDAFRNTTARRLSLTLDASSADADSAPANNTAVQDGTVQPFLECGDIDLGDQPGVAAGGGCFISEAVHGSPLEPHVQPLRDFRDRHLKRTAAGRAFTAFYYRHSPPLVGAIAAHEPLRVLVRLLLAPLVYSVAYPRAGVAAWMLAATLLVPTVRHIRRRRRPDLGTL